jgi:hypothetical protein
MPESLLWKKSFEGFRVQGSDGFERRVEGVGGG